MRKKRQSNWQCRLVLLGPTSVKAARTMLVKLTPGVNFININSHFARVDPKRVKNTDDLAEFLFFA